MPPIPLSCYIIACNEADRLARTLQSVKSLLEDVVVVINPESSDDTEKIAKDYGARIFIHPWEGYGPQKRFAEDQCKHDWLLNLDADEWLSPKLAREISHLFQKGEPLRPVWRAPIKNTLVGETTPRFFQRCWHKNSLYKKTRFRMTDRPIHEGVNAPKKYVGRLKQPIFHQHARSLSHLYEKYALYAEQDAAFPKSLPVLLLRLFLEFPIVFLKRGILYREFLFGAKSFAQVMIYSFGRFIRIAIMLEKRLQWEMRLAPAPRAPAPQPILSDRAEEGRLPISCFIITKNEADRVGRALQSVRSLCDDVLVVDSGSDDETRAVAESFGARFLENRWQGYGIQKRFGSDQSAHDYVINLDADEWLSDELAQEIRALVQTGAHEKSRCYSLRRRNIFPGETRPRAFVKEWHIPRFYDQRHVHWTKSVIAEGLRGYQKENVRKLRGPLLHAPVRSFGDQALKENRYGDQEAHLAKPLPILYIRLFAEFPFQFLKIYFLRRHVFGGIQGFIMAMIYSFSRFLRIAKKLEHKKEWVQTS